MRASFPRRRPPFAFTLSLGALALGALTVGPLAACRQAEPADAPTWSLVWSDEFDGTMLDASKWTPELGSSFGTGQLDYDTERPENISVENGFLRITARAEPYRNHGYTSGRITTKGKLTQRYGRFEAKMKLPHGQGMWPAFWLLGASIDAVGWPTCGEIDVMENRGIERSKIHGSLHGPGYYAGSALTRSHVLPEGETFSDDFHVFAIEWEPGVVRFYVDDVLYQTRTADKMPRTQRWVFEEPFFVIVNLAVGGHFGGPPDETTLFPQSLEVDYVRVYRRANESPAPAEDDLVITKP